jgi:xylulose-5-phosphate/fructose-6-phosphate phosphoketolase
MMANALSNKELGLMDAYWRAANYLSVGQIYLYDKIHGSRRYTKRA